MSLRLVLDEDSMAAPPTSIVCVLKSGGEFGPHHVERLCGLVWAHTAVPVLCLADVPVEETAGLTVDRLEHGWPGWWSKMEVYRRHGPCLYLDLDVTPIGDLTPLLNAATKHDMVITRDYWDMNPHYINGSVIGWRGDAVRQLYGEFAEAPVAFMDIYRTGERWNDQGFIRDHWRGEWVSYQDECPGTIWSFKREVLTGTSRGQPVDLSNARLIVSHGKPRPWAPGGADDWLRSRGYLPSAG